MPIQSIGNQDLKASKIFKAVQDAVKTGEKSESNSAGSTQKTPEHQTEYFAAKVTGGAAALALLGFGIARGVKNSKIQKALVKEARIAAENAAKQAEGKAQKAAEELTKADKSAHTKRKLYKGKNGDALFVLRDKDGQIMSTMRRKKLESILPTSAKTKKEQTVDLDKKFKEIVIDYQEKNNIPEQYRVKTEDIKAPVIRTVSGRNIFMSNPKEINVIKNKPQNITKMVNYVNEDGTVSQKPVKTTIISRMADGEYRIESPFNQNFVKATEVKKDGTKNVTLFTDSGEEILNLKYKGNISEEQYKFLTGKYN